ncbi:MAG: IS30 family transposase [Kurthia sp.]|nr:IS30 family transposase [Candidatus Kurthia equi]
MNLYTHLTINERERIFLLINQGQSIRQVAYLLKRNPSTISRELKRNCMEKTYSPSAAQATYQKRKWSCGRKLLLANPQLKKLIKKLFLKNQWSPEQISARLKMEGFSFRISYTTIYRAIYRGDFNEKGLSSGNRGAIRKLRHKGKTRHTKNHIEKRGKISITQTIHERPLEANNRTTIGHWEADTVLGKTGRACLVTLTDRKSRYLLAGKVEKKLSVLVRDTITELLLSVSKNKRKSITPDRGKEFSKHKEVTEKLDSIPFYFADPHAPWQRGTNENTNGLLREYFPKTEDMTDCSPTYIDKCIEKLNKRPRKCLEWKSPYEIFFNKVLRLI